MHRFDNPGSYYVQCTRLLALVVIMYNIHVYWPGSYNVQYICLLALVGIMYNSHVYLPW